MKKFIVMLLTVLTLLGAGLTAYGANASAPTTGSSGAVFRGSGSTAENGSSGRVFRPGSSYSLPDSDVVVYIVKGKKSKKIYHTNPACTEIKHKPTAKTLKDVKKCKYTICEKCASEN